MSAQEYIQRVGIFVSSPGDMNVERQIVKRVVEELNSRASIKNQYRLEALLYEEMVPPTAGDFAQMIVDRYMNVQNAYIVIGMMWSRMGTPFKHPQTRESFESGTEYEIKMAYRNSADSAVHEPHLLLYRKSPPNSEGDQVQQASVDQFFRKIEQQQGEVKGLYQTFSKSADFRQMLLQHIEQILVEHPVGGTPDGKPNQNGHSPTTMNATQNRGTVVQNHNSGNQTINTSGGDYVGGNKTSYGGDHVVGNKVIVEQEHPEITLLKREISDLREKNLPELQRQLSDAKFQAKKQQNIARMADGQRRIQSVLMLFLIIVAGIIVGVLGKSPTVGSLIAVGGSLIFLAVRRLFRPKVPLSPTELIEQRIVEVQQEIADRETKITQHYQSAARKRAGAR